MKKHIDLIIMMYPNKYVVDLFDVVNDTQIILFI